MPRKAEIGTTPELFWKWVDIRGKDECWEWTRAKITDGYGQISNNNKRHISHRVAYELTYGEIPTGVEVCHKCDNPACCNPNHLFLGTHDDNMKDMGKKDRNSRKKITRQQVDEIRRLEALGDLTNKEIGDMFGISSPQVSRIANHLEWN